MICVSFSSRYFNRFDLSDKDSFFDSKTRSTIVSVVEGFARHQQGGPGETDDNFILEKFLRVEEALIVCD